MADKESGVLDKLLDEVRAMREAVEADRKSDTAPLTREEAADRSKRGTAWHGDEMAYKARERPNGGTDQMQDTDEKILERLSSIEALLRVQNRATLRAKEAAEFLGVCPRTLHDLVKAGRIKRVQLSNGRFGFRREEMVRYACENEAFYADTDKAWLDAIEQ